MNFHSDTRNCETDDPCKYPYVGSDGKPTDKGKKCKCYVRDGTPKDEYNEDQFCAYLNEEGFLVGCNEGCCNGGKGCPGQCDNVEPKEPEAYDPNLPTSSSTDDDDNSDDKSTGTTKNKIYFTETETIIIGIFILIIGIILAYYLGKANFLESLISKFKA